MSIRYLDLSGAVNFWTNIKNFILSKIPTKTSELTNDSGFLTQHQSLSNYVTLNSEQTIAGKKLFTNSTTKVNSVNTFTGSTQFIDLSTTVPRGAWPAEDHRVGRVYIGDNTSYNGAWFIVDPTITSTKAYYRVVTTNPDNTDSTRFSITWDSTKEGARRRRNVSMGDLICATNNTYQIGESGNVWKDVYATNYYYGADAVEFSTKFVTSDTAQTITGAKTFSSTITGSISGNASTATEFSANKDVTLTGDVTGTASSKAGWSVSTTLSNSGVTAGTYGPSADVTGSNNATILVPEITVDAKGRVTSVTNRTYTSVNTDNDKKVYQYYKSDDNVYRLLFSNNAGNTATSNVGAVYSGLNNSFYVNPSTGALYATKLYSNGVEVLTAHQSLSNYVTLNTAQEITNTKTFKDATTARKLTSVEAGNVIPTSDKLISDIWQDKNGKELGRIYYTKTSGGNTALIMRAGDWFSGSEGVYSLNASGTNRRAELHLYSDSSGNCCIKPVGYFSATLKPLSSSVWLGESTKPFGRVYANAFEFCNAGLLPDTDVQTTEEHSVGFFGQNNTPLSYITFQKRPNLKDRIAVRIQTATSAYKSYCFDATCFYPESNNNLDIGSTTNIFKNIYCNNYYKGTTAFGDIVTHNASEFLTQHPSITLSTNTTSTESPSHGGTFTCIDSVTQDTNGHITKVNTKTVTLPADSNTDTKVTQTVTNDNACYPLLIANTASASHTGSEPTTETDEVRKAYNINVHARYGFIYARNSYNHDNLKGSVAGGNRTSAAFYGSTYDGAIVGGVELGRVDKYGNRYSRLYATNYITDGALAPDGTAVATTFDVGVLADGTKYLTTSAGWYCNVYPTVNNTRTLGTSSLRWKECYSNAYYLGTTAFGDIVTHNASEFLTSHQSLSSCVKNVVTNNQIIKSTGITRGTAPSSAQTFGIAFTDNNNKYISNIYGQYATDKSTYVGLYAYKGTTTSNGDNVSVRVGYDASGNAYTYAPTPATADNSTQIATTAFVKAQGYLTSHQSLANYVTTNTDQSISGIKSHSKHISILGDYVGNESSTNGRSCLYLKANRDTDGKSGLYVTKFRQNVAQGSMGNSDVVFLSHDILENETRTNAGFVESYSNWTNDVPGGMSIYSSIATRNLGTSAKPWTNAYITNLNLNGNAFDPTSIDGIGATRLLAYQPASTSDLSNPAGTTKSGSRLYDVRMTLHNSTGDSGIFDDGSFGVTVDTNRTQSGTWKVLHYISVGVPSVSHTSFAIAMWVRIA